jgi:hypothetical protein
MIIISPSQFLVKAPLNDFSYAALQDWVEESCRLMVKFVFWIPTFGRVQRKGKFTSKSGVILTALTAIGTFSR